MAKTLHERELVKLKEKIEELEHQNGVMNKQLVEKEELLARRKERLMLTNEELDLANKKVTGQKDKIDNMNNLMEKQEDLIKKIKDKLMCPVCLIIPRHGPVFLCPNGHLVCQNCKRTLCPMCRTAMGPVPGKSLLASTILENIDHKCKFDECDELFAIKALANHEMVCRYRTVSCPHPDCSVKVPLSELVDHLLKSDDNCSYDREVTCAVHEEWISFSYTYGNFSKELDEDDDDLCWKAKIYNFGDDTFVVYPLRFKGHFYYVVAMLDTETKCAEFNLELIVHGMGQPPLHSKNNVKFQGHPLSIDLKEEELNLFGTSQRFMAKLLETADDKNSFCISFKISRKCI